MLITTRDTAPDVDDQLRVLLGDLARMRESTTLISAGCRRPMLPTCSPGSDPRPTPRPSTRPAVTPCSSSRSPAALAARPSLHAMLARRYALVTDADLTVLDVASVVGTEFDADVVARSVGCDLEATLASLERIAQPVSATPCPVDRDSSRSPMRCSARPLRQHSPHTRLVIHRAVAALAARLPADEAVLPELARHASIAAPLGNASRPWTTRRWRQLEPNARWRSAKPRRTIAGRSRSPPSSSNRNRTSSSRSPSSSARCSTASVTRSPASCCGAPPRWLARPPIRERSPRLRWQ